MTDINETKLPSCLGNANDVVVDSSCDGAAADAGRFDDVAAAIAGRFGCAAFGGTLGADDFAFPRQVCLPKASLAAPALDVGIRNLAICFRALSRKLSLAAAAAARCLRLQAELAESTSDIK